jgi:hypothetical protein
MNMTAARLKIPGKADGFLRLTGFSSMQKFNLHAKMHKINGVMKRSFPHCVDLLVCNCYPSLI